MDNEMNKMELLRQVAAAHFMVEDLHLYLNTHPMDREVLVKHNAFIMQFNMLKQTYERQFGLIDQDSCSPFPFQWINEPWPWEYEANYKL
jgi:spore coat protein JB